MRFGFFITGAESLYKHLELRSPGLLRSDYW